MRVFVTGGTGFIGSSVIAELQGAGHRVLGLARSEAAAETLRRAGAEPHRGDLSDPDSLAEGAKASDGVIHLAFIHDFSQYVANAEIDRRATAAMADALAGTGKALIVTSGTAVIPAGRVAVETDAVPLDGSGHVRGASEAVLSAAPRGVAVGVVRLPPSVHGRGDQAFVPALIGIARATGVSAYLGQGDNRWPAVHRLDAARLFRSALEAAAPGAVYHGAAEDGVPTRSIAEAIGEGLGVPTRSLSPEEAPDHFGFLAAFIGLDNPTSSTLTRARLNWTPREPDLLTDMRDGGYFDPPPT